MQPINFKEQTNVLAKDQPEYLSLPVFISSDKGTIISCWRFSFWERLRVLFFGKLWLRQLTFGNKLQPQLPEVGNPFYSSVH